MRLHSTEMVKERVLTKRKNRGDDTQQQFQEGTESGNAGGGWEEAVKAVASGRRLGGARKRFVGVRQRPSGRWVAEIKDTIQKIRLWLGTFDTAEEAARAYDEAACLLRGANTRTNFWPCSPNSNPDSKAPSALPSKVSRLLLLRLKARNSAMNQPQLQEHEVNNNTQFSELINSPNSFDCDEFTTSPEYEPCSTVESTQFNQMNNDLDYDWSDVGQISGSDPNDGVLAEEVDRTIDLQFIDDGSVAMGDYSAFEIAEEIAEEEPLLVQESGGAIASSDESSMLRVAMKRMKYERKISASLYAMNGISECLRLRLGGFVQELNQNKQADRVSEESSTQLLEPSSASSSSTTTTTMSGDNGVEISESLLWSSLDLAPICSFLNYN